MSAERRFSEAMWFKKGELEDDAEPAAAPESAPIADRYQDDGSLTNDDLARYNLRTGRTEPVSAIRSSAPPAPAIARPFAPGLGGDARVLPFALAAAGVILAIGVVARLLG